MNSHGEATAVADASTAAHAHDEHAAGHTDHLFEKSELDDFVAEDREAGVHIGQLLAAVFLISLVLMTGVCWWMFRNASQGHDPQAGIGTAAETEHH